MFCGIEQAVLLWRGQGAHRHLSFMQVQRRNGKSVTLNKAGSGHKHERKWMLSVRMRAGTPNCNALSLPTGEVILPIPRRVWLNYCDVAGQLLFQSRGTMPAGNCVPLWAQNSQSHMAQLLTKLQFQSVRKATVLSLHTGKLQPLPWPQHWVVYTERCQVFGNGKGLQFLPVQTTGQTMLWLCADKEERKAGSSSQGTHRLSLEVRTYMPVALPDEEHHPFPLTRHNLPSLHHPPLGCKTRLPTGQGSFQSWGQPIQPNCWGSGNIFSSTAL